MALLQSGNVSAAYMPEREERGGFNFDNVARNTMMSNNGLAFKAAMKTGTGANPTAYFLSRAAGVQARRVAGADGQSQSRGGAGGTAPVTPSPLYATQKSGDMPPPPPRRPSGGAVSYTHLTLPTIYSV